MAVEDWLRYATPESLALFMYQKPKAAKRLYFDVIPRTMDDYLTFRDKFPDEDAQARLNNPVWHIHNGQPPVEKSLLSFNILLNLVSVAHSEDKAAIWHFISRYAPDASPEKTPTLDKLVEYAIAYYRDFVKPAKKYRAATPEEAQAFADLADGLEKLAPGATAEEIQNLVYEIGKRPAFPELKAWFKASYEVLLGQDQGPRLGTFIALYGIGETIALLRKAASAQPLG